MSNPTKTTPATKPKKPTTLHRSYPDQSMYTLVFDRATLTWRASLVAGEVKLSVVSHRNQPQHAVSELVALFKAHRVMARANRPVILSPEHGAA